MRRMKKVKEIGSKILTLLVVLSMTLSMSMMVMAADENEVENGAGTAVSTDPRDSILQLVMSYEDDAANRLDYQRGTCFLINDEYVLTNKHLYSLDNALKDKNGNTLKDEDGNTVTVRRQIMHDFGLSELNDNDPHLKLYLLVNKDMRILATVHNSVQSDDMDFAAVKLSEKIYDRAPVSLGDSDAVATKDKVYAMGFPEDSASTKDYNTKDDVSTVDGIISKITVTGNVDIIEHTAPLNFGNSGGPLLNEDNQVIGINTFMSGKRNYSIRLTQSERTGYIWDSIQFREFRANRGELVVKVKEPEKEEDNSALIIEASKMNYLMSKGWIQKITRRQCCNLDDSIRAAEIGTQEFERRCSRTSRVRSMT